MNVVSRRFIVFPIAVFATLSSMFLSELWAAEFIPITDAIEASDYSIPGQSDISLAMTPDGYTITVWADRTGRDGNDQGVFAQLFSPEGDKIGENFQINDQFAGRQTDPRLAFSPDCSRLVIGWESDKEAYARVYSVSMDPFAITPLSEPFIVSALGDASFGDNTRNISFFPDGTFVISFMSWDGDIDGISARRFTLDGDPIDTIDIFVNGQIADDQTDNSVLALADGSFVVVWESRFEGAPGQLGTDGDGNSIQLQIINPDGSGRFQDKYGNSEVVVNTATERNQRSPNLDLGKDGTVLLAWQDPAFEDPSLPGDGTKGEIVGQFINPNADTVEELFIGEQFLINTHTTGDVDEIWIEKIGDRGEFIAVYESDVDPKGNPFLMEDGTEDESIVMTGLDAEGNPVIDTYVVPQNNTIGPNDDPYVATGDSIFAVVWSQEVPRNGPERVYIRFFANPFSTPVEEWMMY